MKKYFLLLLSTLGAHLLSAQQPSRKVVFLIADSIPADVIEKAATSNIKKIAAVGTYLRAYVGGDTHEYTNLAASDSLDFNNSDQLNQADACGSPPHPRPPQLAHAKRAEAR